MTYEQLQATTENVAVSSGCAFQDLYDRRNRDGELNLAGEAAVASNTVREAQSHCPRHILQVASQAVNEATCPVVGGRLWSDLLRQC